MGSSFLRSALDPIGSTISRFAGPNSFYAKANAYDPLMSSPVGKFMSPGNYNVGQQYANRHNDPNPVATAAQRPTPYAGVDPTLRDANAGYVNAANQAVAQRNKTWQQGSFGSPQGSPYGQ
jgi:hypothetical protein